MISFRRLAKMGRVARVSLFQRKNWRMFSNKYSSPDSTKSSKILNEYVSGEKSTVPHEPKPIDDSSDALASMWTVKNCDDDLCPMDLRYDMKYYSISDKTKRKYQVTWTECPRLLIKPRKVCMYENVKRPKIERRPRQKDGRGQKGLGTAKRMPQTPCVYVVSPGCKVGRRPPKCKEVRIPVSCEKRKTPYPSFSECRKDPVTPLRPQECYCLNVPALCDAWATMRRRVVKGQSRPLSEGKAT